MGATSPEVPGSCAPTIPAPERGPKRKTDRGGGASGAGQIPEPRGEPTWLHIADPPGLPSSPSPASSLLTLACPQGQPSVSHLQENPSQPLLPGVSPEAAVF